MALDRGYSGDLSAAVLATEGGADFAKESYLSEYIPYLSFVGDNTILLKQGDLLATLRLDGVNPMTTPDAELDALKRAVAAIVSITGNTFGFYVHRISVPQNLSLAPIEGIGFAAEIDRRWQRHIRDLAPKKRCLYLSVVRRPNLASRLPILNRFATRNYLRDRDNRIQQLDEVVNFFKEALASANPVRLTRHGGEWLGYLGALNSGAYMPIAEGKSFQTLASQASNCRAIFDRDLVTICDVLTGQLRYGAMFSALSQSLDSAYLK